MKSNVNYLMSGIAHLPYLVVSLKAFRRYHPDTHITVHAYPESFDIVQKMAKDADLNISPRIWEPDYKGKNGQFINKIQLMRSLRGSNKTEVYFDADTVAVTDLSEGFDDIPSGGFRATQFNEWKSTGKIVSKRIKRLQGISGIDQEAVLFALENKLPSVNGGVFGCDPASDVLDLWLDWTMKAKGVFIADETVLHAVMAHEILKENKGEGSLFEVLQEGGRWNSSPRYKNPALKEEDVKIWHFHGDSNLRRNKSKFGYKFWTGLFESALENNVGGMADWIEAPARANKYLKIYMEENGKW